MPNATQTNQFLAINWLEQGFIDKLMLALKAAGFPAPYDYHPALDVGTNRYIVYEFIGDATKAKGRIYLRIRWTVNATTGAISLFSSLFDTWSTANRTGTNQGTEIACGLAPVPTSAVDFASFSHPEIKHVAFTQNGTSWGFLNFVRPSIKMAIRGAILYDEANYPYGFISAGADFATLYGVATGVAPTGELVFSLGILGNLSNKFASFNCSQVLPSPYILTGASNQGAVAQFSSELGICGSNGMPTLAEVNDPGAGQRRVLLMGRGNSGLVLNCDSTVIQS